MKLFGNKRNAAHLSKGRLTGLQKGLIQEHRLIRMLYLLRLILHILQVNHAVAVIMRGSTSN